MNSSNTAFAHDCTVVMPAKNEAKSLVELLPALKAQIPGERILVVDDGSTDDTVNVCRQAGVGVVSHPYSKGNGASVKTGIRNVKTELVLLMDADGQHRPEDAVKLLDRLAEGYDLVVGARSASSQASV